jgi:hypothetical protein
VKAGDPGDLRRLRRLFPAGTEVTGEIDHTPWRKGVTGLFVRLPAGSQGLVDVLSLPEEADRWPDVGDRLDFEVLACRPGQVRLWPMDPRYRPDRPRFDTGDTEAAHLFVIGQTVQAVVRQVFTADSSCLLELPGGHLVATGWDDDPPRKGDGWTVHIVRHGPATRRVIVERA